MCLIFKQIIRQQEILMRLKKRNLGSTHNPIFPIRAQFSIFNFLKKTFLNIEIFGRAQSY